MRRTLLLSTVAAASIALLAACNKSADNQAPAPTPSPTTENTPAPGTNSETVSAVQDATSGVVGAVDAATTTSTPGFVEAATLSDMYEIEAAKLALQRSKRDDIKHFAQEMIDAHTKTSADLKGLLAANNVSVTIPTALDDRRKSMIDNLTGAAEHDFDGRYIDQQEMAHNEALTLFKNYGDNGDNPAIKQFAVNTAPAISQHLTEARKLDEAVENKNSQAPTQ